MYNLIAFIKKRIDFFFFLLLEIICFYLIVRNNSYQRAAVANSSNAIAGNVLSLVADISEYFHLKEENEQLAAENAYLHSISKAAYTAVLTSSHLTTVKDTLLKQQYQFLHAKIINNSVNKRNNYLTLDKGSKHGIKPEVAVICSNGIVGITKDVSENFTSVLSVLNKDAKISAKLKKNNYFGSLSWNGVNYQYGTLTDIPTHVPVKVGDTVVTNTFSAIFPENIMIGTIHGISKDDGGNFYILDVKYSTNFKNVTHVYVVTNLYKEEQRKLEERSQKSDY
jgi:rod shape-determining protein MreC